jgi:methylated-DNA-[protein]-cysteine S-methyltransferase
MSAMNRHAAGEMTELHAAEQERLVDELVSKAHTKLERAMRWVRRPAARIAVVPSPIGRLLLAEGPRGLVAVQFLAINDGERTLAGLRRRFDLVENSAFTSAIHRELDRYFHGDIGVLRHPVDLSLVQSEFQRRALERLRRVPAGSVITYRGLADAIGEPSSQRAIGNTMAANPVPIFVPCHRVIRSDGSIGNYGGGVERKLRLLRAEGFAVGRDLRLPARAVLGHRATQIFCRPGCAAAERANRARMLIFADPEHARRAGMRACKVCRPA